MAVETNPQQTEPDPRQAGSARRTNPLSNVLLGLERGGLPLLLIFMCVFFAADATSSTIFTSKANIDNLLGDQAVVAMVALAMVIPLVAGYFDLSASAIAGVANVAVAATIGTHHWSIEAGILFALVIGAVIGFINGYLVAKLRLSAFVVTLGSYTLLGGLALYYTKGSTITSGIPKSFGIWGAQNFLGVPRPFLLLIGVALVTWYLITYTPFGRYTEAIGSNEQAARLVGINVTRTVWVSFVLSGMLAAAAGALQTSRAGNGTAETASAFLLPAFTAVFLGATTIRPGRYNVWGTLVGVYFVAVSVNGLTLLGASLWVQPVFDGASLIIAVALSTLIARERERRMSAVKAPDRDVGTGTEAETPIVAAAD
jgi:ribose transport system permease protein